MNTRRGEIVMCDFPYSDMSGSKVRPALVVMDDAYQKLNLQGITFLLSGDLGLI